MSKSTAQLIADLPAEERRRFLELLSPDEQAALPYSWPFWARAEQLAPVTNPRRPDGAWRTWLLCSGRGFGKTKSGSEWVRGEIEAGRRRSIGLIGPTKESTRKTMIEGPSGILACCPPWNRPVFEPSNLRLVWPNGAMCHLFTAEEPEKLRGPNLDGFWGDELCAWGGGVDSNGGIVTGNNSVAARVYDMLSLCLRIPGPLGDPPREIITTTPKPMPLLREIMKNPNTVVVGGSIFDNAANLDATTLQFYVDKYNGTRLGRQELYGELLDAFEGALWSPTMLDLGRRGPNADPAKHWQLDRSSNSGAVVLLGPRQQRIYFKRIVVSIDPAGSSNRKSNETGIVVCGLGEDGDGYLFHDESGIYSPEEWSRRAVALYYEWSADRILAENNYGGEMVESTVRATDRNVPVRVLHASKGKRVRAEPVSALYEQTRIHHVGQFNKLEDQLVTWDPMGNGDSPDRLDATVWGFTDLMLKRPGLRQRSFARPSVIPIYQR